MSRLFNRVYLVENLLLMHGMMVAAVPLLRFAIGKSGGELREYYRKHSKEEEGHERMLRDDLAALGITDFQPHFEAAKIAGSQYYLIAHENPAALLGYMLALEPNALNEFHVSQIERVHGTELTCLRHHAIHDPHHTKELKRQIEMLSPKVRALVEWNHDSVMNELIWTLNSIWQYAENKELLNA